jgi:hypothetical protein
MSTKHRPGCAGEWAEMVTDRFEGKLTVESQRPLLSRFTSPNIGDVKQRMGAISLNGISS